MNPRTVFSNLADIFHLPPGNEMRLHAEEIEELGLRVFVFQQFFEAVEYDFQPEKTDLQIPDARSICAET